MEQQDYDELVQEKQKLYSLLTEARKAGVSISKIHAIIEQSEKIDSLVIKLQYASGKTE